jgi:hypothetical protein
MARRKRGRTRIRVGRVTLYLHHGAWWLYFSEGSKRVRRKVGESQHEAEFPAAASRGRRGAPGGDRNRTAGPAKDLPCRKMVSLRDVAASSQANATSVIPGYSTILHTFPQVVATARPGR